MPTPHDFLLYDSHLKRKVAFVPIRELEARIYICGPTVYDDAHLGHARSAISFDLLNRTLHLLGMKVTLVKNFTDIDDKIIKKSKDTNKPFDVISEHYIASYISDMHALNVLDPDIAPRATTSLKDIATLIQALLDKDIAYYASNGDIFLDVSRDSEYGSLSHLDLDASEQSRVSYEDDIKRNSRDFVLWKAAPDESEIGFPSPFGRGRPGWHIECSAMIKETIAYDAGEFLIDIHAGGADLLFPHHENEASQTRCAEDRTLSKYWMHNGFVTIDGEKMSKSLKNSFFVKDALAKYDGELLRYYLLGSHYRAALAFNEVDLIAANKRLSKIYRLKERLGLPAIKKSHKSQALFLDAGEPSPRMDAATNCSIKEELLNALCDDLNTSPALASIDAYISEANATLDSGGEVKDACEFFELLYLALGIGYRDPKEVFKSDISDEEDERIKEMIKERAKAKAARDFKRADEIRDELARAGIALKDGKEGTVYERIDVEGI